MTIRYEYRKVRDDSDEFAGCESCYAAAPLGEFARYPASKRRGERLLCEICATTAIGRITETRHTPEVDVLVAIAAVGNLLLDKLTERRKAAEDGDYVLLPYEEDPEF